MRAGSRQRGIFWLRILVAGITTLIAGGVLQFHSVSRGGTGAQTGQYLLGALAWLALVSF